MSERIYVKPANDKTIVRMPEKDFKHMPAAGAWVRRNAYYIRRMNEGSVVSAKPPAKVKPAAAPAKSASSKKES